MFTLRVDGKGSKPFGSSQRIKSAQGGHKSGHSERRSRRPTRTSRLEATGPGGEIGRRKGLKILFPATGVWVQVPPRAPSFLQLNQHLPNADPFRVLAVYQKIDLGKRRPMWPRRQSQSLDIHQISTPQKAFAGFRPKNSFSSLPPDGFPTRRLSPMTEFRMGRASYMPRKPASLFASPCRRIS
jgi:hypothetical protein